MSYCTSLIVSTLKASSQPVNENNKIRTEKPDLSLCPHVCVSPCLCVCVCVSVLCRRSSCSVKETSSTGLVLSLRVTCWVLSAHWGLSPSGSFFTHIFYDVTLCLVFVVFVPLCCHFRVLVIFWLLSLLWMCLIFWILSPLLCEHTPHCKPELLHSLDLNTFEMFLNTKNFVQVVHHGDNFD